MKNLKVFENKIIGILIGLFLIMFFVLFFIFQGNNKSLSVSVFFPKEIVEQKEDLKIAGCPTFYYLLENLEKEGFSVIKTASTAESLAYLGLGVVDFAISGRRLVPSEPEFSFKVIGDGFSVFSGQSFTILDKEMDLYNFFTDLDVEEILEKFEYISKDKIFEVEDVYDYLDYGIIITSSQNTDYSRAEIVNIFLENGKRHRYSRIPHLYYFKLNSV